MAQRKDPVVEFIRWIATADPEQAKLALKMAQAVTTQSPQPPRRPRAPRTPLPTAE